MLELDCTAPPTLTYSELWEIKPGGVVAFDLDLSWPAWATPPDAPRTSVPMPLTVIYDPLLPGKPAFGDEVVRFGGDGQWPVSAVIEFPAALGFKLEVLIQKVRVHGRTWASVQHRRYFGHDRASGSPGRFRTY